MQLFTLYQIYTYLNSLDHVSPKNITWQHLPWKKKSTLQEWWFVLTQHGSGFGNLGLEQGSGRLFLGICPNISFFFGRGGAAGNSATQCISKMLTLMLLQKYAPLQIFQQQNTIKTRPPFLRPELAKCPPPFSCAQRLASRNVTSCVATTLRLDPKFLTYQTCPKTQHDTNTPFSQGLFWKNCQAVFRWNKNSQQETCVFLMIMFHVYCNYNNNEDYVFFLGPNWYWFSSLDKRFFLGVFDGSKSTQKTLAGSHHITELLDKTRAIPFIKNIFI